jgi:hypothetical protein
MTFEVQEPTRLSELPDRPLVVGPELIEIALSANGFIHLFSLTPKFPGALDDMTKLQFAVAVNFIRADTGEDLGRMGLRMGDEVFYDDPIGAGTTPDLPPIGERIMDRVITNCKELQPWLDRQVNHPSLFDQLAI